MNIKKKIALLLVAIMMMCIFTACGSSKYEDDFNSGWDKFLDGNYGSMSDSEKRAVNDFLEWANDN